MLSSIILSLAISITPTPVADTHNLDFQEIDKTHTPSSIETVSKRRGSLRINAADDLNVETVSKRRGSLRINAENNLSIETVSKRRGSLRINTEGDLTIKTISKRRGSLRI